MLDELRVALSSGFDLSWQDEANCKGANADLFFPERGASTRSAKAICREC
jgi:WhiB family redox-sensing transcriptional regulator